jgi:signal transduction histidine kinase
MKEHLPLAPINVETLIQGMIETYPAFQFPHAEVKLEGRFPEVLGNETALIQCISNLLGNAVKFIAPGARPLVRVWAEQASGRVRLLFKDNGIGIPKDAHQKIFQLFQRLDNKWEGTGIGLAIVKKAAERMGGKVGVDSEVGNGSTFWLELPRPDDAQGQGSGNTPKAA